VYAVVVAVVNCTAEAEASAALGTVVEVASFYDMDAAVSEVAVVAGVVDGLGVDEFVMALHTAVVLVDSVA